MKEEIFWGNLIGLLKHGKWSMSGAEALAFGQIYEECLKRSKPKLEEIKEPITKSAPIKGKRNVDK